MDCWGLVKSCHMEKIICRSKDHQVMSGFGYAIHNDEIGYIVGRVATLLEALGLSVSQEKAIKDLVKQELYYGLQERTTYLPGPLMSVISEYHYKEKEMASKENLPPGSDADFELTYLPKV